MVGSIGNKFGYGQAHRNRAKQKLSYVQSNAQWRERRQASNERYLTTQFSTARVFSTNAAAAANKVNLTMQIVTQNYRADMQNRLAAQTERLNKLDRSLDISV